MFIVGFGALGDGYRRDGIVYTIATKHGFNPGHMFDIAALVIVV